MNTTNTNTTKTDLFPIQRHGHVRPLPNGATAKCFGPTLCVDCIYEKEYDAAATGDQCELARLRWIIRRALQFSIDRDMDDLLHQAFEKDAT